MLTLWRPETRGHAIIHIDRLSFIAVLSAYKPYVTWNTQFYFCNCEGPPNIHNSKMVTFYIIVSEYSILFYSPIQ